MPCDVVCSCGPRAHDRRDPRHRSHRRRCCRHLHTHLPPPPHVRRGIVRRCRRHVRVGASVHALVPVRGRRNILHRRRRSRRGPVARRLPSAPPSPVRTTPPRPPPPPAPRVPPP